MSNNLSWKCQRFTPSGCEDIGIRIFDFVANTQFLYVIPPPPPYILTHPMISI